MIRIVAVSDVEDFAASARPKPAQTAAVDGIISDVRENGDAALRRYEEQFGGSAGPLRVPEREIKKARDGLSSGQVDAINLARSRLADVETRLRESLQDIAAGFRGVRISRRFEPIGSAGCYVPGGLARYPSSAVMSVTTAKVAGVDRVVVITPSRMGEVDPVTLASADICGADEVYGVGGAHGIAALAYGTETIRPVGKIVGPGGAFVTAAKAAVSQDVSVDMLAGPTELAVIADSTTNPEYVASDIMAQAEHSRDTFCYVITTSMSLAVEVQRAVRQKIKTAQRRDIIQASLAGNGFIAVCQEMSDAARLADILAPEHLQIMTESPGDVAKGIKSAGLVLLGSDTPSTASDYLLGTNHILPTGGQGRVRGSLSVLDFMKLGTTVASDADALAEISGHMMELAMSEGLPNHYESVRCRT